MANPTVTALYGLPDAVGASGACLSPLPQAVKEFWKFNYKAVFTHVHDMSDIPNGWDGRVYEIPLHKVLGKGGPQQGFTLGHRWRRSVCFQRWHSNGGRWCCACGLWQATMFVNLQQLIHLSAGID